MDKINRGAWIQCRGCCFTIAARYANKFLNTQVGDSTKSTTTITTKNVEEYTGVRKK